MTSAEAEFIRAHTTVSRAPLVPEFRLHLATEITPIWQATEQFLRAHDMAPPFWAFAWPGAQALARHMLDHADRVAGRRVLDFASGCGLAALAASRAGAASVEASEIDPLAVAAIGLNAALNDAALNGPTLNGAAIHAMRADMVGQPCRWDLILCGDICYEAPMARHVEPWLRATAASGAQVWIADPGRAYLPHEGLRELARYVVPTSMELEDRTTRVTRLFALS